jgi:hypothetical protein
MNSRVQYEIKDAIWQVQSRQTRTTLRAICLMCKYPLKEWDVRKRKAVCWYCRKKYFPEPEIQGRSLPAKPIKLVPQKDGSYLVLEE